MSKPMLETVGLTKAFGKLIAVNNVNLKVEEGELRAIIGPNGAGKTTLFNLIIGALKPTSGKVFLRGRDITGLRPHVISRMGIAASFQLTNVFLGMTVMENVWASVQSLSRRRWSPFIKAESMAEVSYAVEEICKLVGLEEKMDEVAMDLSHGDQRLLEIAIALGLNPTLLILDEPTAGVSPKEAENILKLIQELSRVKTIVLTEHNVEAVLRTAEVITVLDEERIIAEGSPHEISMNEEVQRVYLGMR